MKWERYREIKKTNLKKFNQLMISDEYTLTINLNSIQSNPIQEKAVLHRINKLVYKY